MKSKTIGNYIFEIIQVNDHSLANKNDKSEVLLLEEKCDLISIVEHWCNIKSTDFMSIPCYRLLFKFCRTTHIHGGTLIYVKSLYLALSLNFR